MKQYTERSLPKKHQIGTLGLTSPLLEQLLLTRGISDVVSVERFLNPDYILHTHDPFLLLNMKKAVTRILKAIDEKEHITIYSDYDADGIPGAVVLHDFFKKIGVTHFSNYIPHREEEGFGFHAHAVEKLKEGKTGLIITIDCGITDVKAVERARDLNIDVIITDHHLPPSIVPDAFTIINPKLIGCTYPEKMLCGSGVIFKVIQALMKSRDFGLKDGSEKWYLDMVGLATVSDMVPLTGENRVFAYYGLKVLRKSPRLGLQKLLHKAGSLQQHLTEDDIGFTISPRINAASRMGNPYDAFKLFSTTDESEATILSDHLDSINNERKGIVASMVKDIRKRIKVREDEETIPEVIVMGNPEWRPALLGLAANALMKDMSRPVFLWGKDSDETYKGSCRSATVSLIDLMNATKKDTFRQFGGHAFSGGFSISKDAIHDIEERLVKAYKKSTGKKEEAVLEVDAYISLDDVTWKLYQDIEKLAPFGVGNPKPLFGFKDVVPFFVKQFGKEKNHLELTFKKSDGKLFKAIAFFSTEDSYGRELRVGVPCTLIATLEKSMFRSFAELRLRIVDVV